jgi:hypothetical protein
MMMAELQEIQDYWSNKYPHIFITLYSNEDNTRFFGKMMAYECSVDLQADTIGELISQGESFLRKVTK